jgi:hypothetical protein
MMCYGIYVGVFFYLIFFQLPEIIAQPKCIDGGRDQFLILYGTGLQTLRRHCLSLFVGRPLDIFISQQHPQMRNEVINDVTSETSREKCTNSQ